MCLAFGNDKMFLEKGGYKSQTMLMHASDAELYIELIEYGYYLDLPSENILVDGPIRISRVFWMDDPGLVLANMSDFGTGTRLQVKEFYLDKYLPVSLNSNKVYSLKLKIERTQGVQEKTVWIDTHETNVSLSGEISHNVTHKNVVLENATINSGTNVYFDSSFKIQGVSTIQPNTGIYLTDLSDECYDN